MQTNTLTDYKMRQLFEFISSLFAPSNDNDKYTTNLTNGAAIKCGAQRYIKLDIEMGGIIPYRDYIILFLE